MKFLSRFCNHQTETFDSGLLKLVAETLMKEKTLRRSSSISSHIIYQLERKSSNCRVEKPGRYYVNQGISAEVSILVISIVA